MMFQKKLDRAMEWVKNKGSNGEQQNSKEEWDYIEQENIKLDKEDILAIIISAIMVFGPILLILMAIIFLVL